MEFEKGGKVSRVASEVKNVGFEALTFGGVCNVVIPEELSPKLKNTGSFFIPYMVSQARIDRVLCDLGASVSFMPYFIFQKLGLGEL